MAGDSGARKQAIRRKAREVYSIAILDAAEQEFSSRGMHGARMADIAAAAGLATGTLYNYFDSKQAIFHSLTERRLSQYNELIAAACAAAATPEDELHALMRTTFAFLDEHRAMYLVVVDLGGASMMGLRVIGGPGAPELQDVYLGIYRKVVADLVGAGRVRDDVSVDRLAAFLVGTMTGLVQEWAMARDERPLVERAGLVCDLFLSGSGAKI